MRLRLAPSLAGHLTLASARLALLTWRRARAGGGHLTLRLDDLDPRDAAHAEDAEYDLRWLGLDWDATRRQSDRRARYAEAAALLERAGRLYPCFETEEELRHKRDLRARQKRATIYDRAMLRLTPEQRAKAEANGKRPYFRFLLSAEPVAWRDEALGRTEIKLSAMSDPVLVRADGSPLPLFASVVDDVDDGITDLVQEEAMAGAAGIGRDIAAALGATRQPGLMHVPALPDAVGRLTLRRLRADGFEPAAVADWLGAPTGELEGLRRRNAECLAALPFAEVQPKLPPGATEAFWVAVRGHLERLTEARGWWDVVAGTIVPPVIEGQGVFLRAALALLPEEPWDGEVWGAWTGALRAATGDDGEAVLRLALTGEDHGPDLGALLPLMGRARAALRLRVAAA